MKISVITPSIRPEGLKIVRECLLNQTFRDFEWLCDINWTGKHDLNASFNRLIRRASGELIVFYQDYIKIENDGLEKFWNAYKEGKTFCTAPVGKSQTLNYDNPKWDWRKNHYGETNYSHWEIDWGSAPKEALVAIGGFDETLDQYWSCDNVNTGFRAYLDGFTFHNVDNPSIAFDHDAHEEHPFRKDYKPEYNNQRMSDFQDGLRINYLS